MAIIKFTATKLVNTGKRGILPRDENGYYTIVIGGLNCLNSAGERYLLEGAQTLFQNDSGVFMRRVRNGCLKAETGHPKRTPGMSNDDYLRRILTIDEKNVCAHFKDVWLDTDYGKTHPELRNPQLCAILAKLIPAGPNGPALQKALDNPDENVCFSIRALTSDFYQNGVNNRVLKSIVNWDWVVEPGIAIATKYDTPCLESISESIVTREEVSRVIQTPSAMIATEDSRIIAQEAIHLFDTSKEIITPKFFKW